MSFAVTLFARKTGDLYNLSSIDLSLIALTYQMCKEILPAEEFNKLRKEPPKNIVTFLVLEYFF